MPRAFLTAHWNNLFLATYAVPPALLEKRLPPGLSLDMRDGSAFVSLVAFEFLHTRVFGVPWPGYRNFGELNLRFYLRQGEQRGVAFIREFVPQRLVAWMARFPVQRAVSRRPHHRDTEGGGRRRHAGLSPRIRRSRTSHHCHGRQAGVPAHGGL